MPAHAATAARNSAPQTPVDDGTASASSRPLRLAALGVLLIVAALYAVSHMDQGIDTWISLAGGRDVAAHGVRDSDPFSFNSRASAAGDAGASGLGHWLHPNGWINQNWLTHLLFFALERAGGLDALVYWKLANYLLVAGALLLAARLRGASAAAGLVAAAAALAASRDFLSIRAQDVTNLLAAVLLVILALARSRGGRWYWALPLLFAVWANAHGGFVFGLLLLAIAVGAEWLMHWRRRPSAAGRGDGALTLALIAAAALAATVVASPYRLANLTHPLLITVSADAPLWRVVREWRPLFSNPLASPVPFTAFAAAVVVAGALAWLRPGSTAFRRAPVADAVMAAAAIALAVASARFVPLACVTAAPLLAVALDAALAGAGRQRAPARRRLVDRAADAALWLAVLAAAAMFTTRAAGTYFGPWPQDAARDGLYDRMTHGHQRPWGACSFLAANGAGGRLWNFWDEGGFLAACQQPDPATGAPSLAIFIDGRAQAAYDAPALRSYLDLLNGPGRSAEFGESSERAADLPALRAWTARRLRELDVWVAVVPAGRQRTTFARAAAALPGWQLAYGDAEHTVFVDGESAAGRSLLGRLDSGTARYPDEATAKLTAGFRLLTSGEAAQQSRAVQLARESYRARPTAVAVLCATRAGRSAAARASAGELCREVVDEFLANRDRHRRASGYGQRLEAAVAALEYLAVEAKRNGQTELQRWAATWLQSCREDQDAVVRRVLW